MPIVSDKKSSSRSTPDVGVGRAIGFCQTEPLSMRASFLASMVLAISLSASSALAQGFGQGNGLGNVPTPAPPVQRKMPSRPTGGLSEYATDEQVVEIRVKGNKTVPASRITAQMQTRAGRPYDPKILSKDIRKLNTLPYFVSVRPLTETTAAGRIIILEVVERSAIRYVEFLGNERIKDKKLSTEVGLSVGGAVDPYAVEEGRRKILQLYKENGFGRAIVIVEEGDKQGDHGVTYVITEGPRQRVWSVEFEGNTFASDGQLRTKIKTKNNLLRLWGGKVIEEGLQEDINRLTDYYRSFGYFRARVGRAIEYSDSGWATLKYVIDEGERYAVRNVSFFGITKFDESTIANGLKQNSESPFERAKLNADLEWIKGVYGSKGYVFADIKAETIFLEEPGKIDLVYKVEEGEKFQVGRINVSIAGEASHTRIPTALNRIGIKPGDIVDTNKIRDAERRLGSSSIFNTNPTQGATPKITYRISERKSRVAEQPKDTTNPYTEYRGQSPDADSTEPQRYTSYKPVGYENRPSVYQVRQGVGVSADVQGQSYPPTNYPPTNSGYVSQAYATTPSYQANTTGQARPSTMQPVQQVQYSQFGQPGPTETLPPPNGYNSTPNYNTTPAYGTAQPNYNPSPVVNTRPLTPVNTTIFPSPVFLQTPVPPPGNPEVDLYVNLEETQTGRFMVGVAVNSDAGLVGQIMLDEQNFDWRRPPRSFQDVLNGTAWRGGGQRFRLEAAPGSQVQRYVASWQEPYLLDTPISLNLSGNYYDRRFDDWDEQRLGGRVGLGYQWTENDLSASLTYRGESVSIHDIQTVNLAIPEYAEMNGDNQLHGFGVRMINDTRNNPFFATEGYYLSGTVEQVIGSFTYSRAELEARSYMLLKERPDHTGRHVLVYQTRLGFTGSDTPVYDRFFAGGFSTMRGFDFRGASPVVSNGTNNVEIGGDFRWLNTLEYLFPLSADGMVNGVAFCDFGTVEQSVKIDDFRVAPGVGLRLTVPAMGPAPIALDLAWPIAKADTDETQVFTFNVGFMR